MCIILIKTLNSLNVKIKKFDDDTVSMFTQQKIPRDTVQQLYSLVIDYGIFGDVSQILTNQKRECTVFSILIG